MFVNEMKKIKSIELYYHEGRISKELHYNFSNGGLRQKTFLYKYIENKNMYMYWNMDDENEKFYEILNDNFAVITKWDKDMNKIYDCQISYDENGCRTENKNGSIYLFNKDMTELNIIGVSSEEKIKIQRISNSIIYIDYDTNEVIKNIILNDNGHIEYEILPCFYIHKIWKKNRLVKVDIYSE